MGYLDSRMKEAGVKSVKELLPQEAEAEVRVNEFIYWIEMEIYSS